MTTNTVPIAVKYVTTSPLSVPNIPGVPSYQRFHSSAIRSMQLPHGTMATNTVPTSVKYVTTSPVSVPNIPGVASYLRFPSSAIRSMQLPHGRMATNTVPTAVKYVTTSPVSVPNIPGVPSYQSFSGSAIRPMQLPYGKMTTSTVPTAVKYVTTSPVSVPNIPVVPSYLRFSGSVIRPMQLLPQQSRSNIRLAAPNMIISNKFVTQVSKPKTENNLKQNIIFKNVRQVRPSNYVNLNSQKILLKTSPQMKVLNVIPNTSPNVSSGNRLSQNIFKKPTFSTLNLRNSSNVRTQGLPLYLVPSSSLTTHNSAVVNKQLIYSNGTLYNASSIPQSIFNSVKTQNSNVLPNPTVYNNGILLNTNSISHSATIPTPSPVNSSVVILPPVSSKLPIGYVNPFDYNTPRSIHLRIQTSNEEKLLTKDVDTWECTICTEVKENKSSLLEHYEFHKKENDKQTIKTSEEDHIECPICFSKHSSMASYERHVEDIHKEREHYCILCKRNFTNAYSLSVHNNERHTPKPDIYTCCVCKKFNCKTSQKLWKHIFMKHDSKQKKYNCTECGKIFTSLSWLNDHKIFHVNTILHECKICHKKFKNKRCMITHNKALHQNKSDGTAKYQCEICDLTFAVAKSLKRHSTTHENQSCLCNICGKTFGNKNKLQFHIGIHSDYKKFVCNVCGKNSIKSNMLVNHMRTHTGERPYKCETCGKRFTQRSPLVIHMRYHTGERPYQCSKCNKGFVSKGTRDIHSKTCKG